MMRSLYAGVSGIKTHQTKMDVIGNNIANVNTVAYKSNSITFGELMYQTTQSASGPNATTGTAGTNPKQIGLGVASGAISTSIASAGATQTTGNPFDLRITGDAFFVVSNGNSNFFTRDGSFYVDSAGTLAMKSNGYNVMGWGLDENGDIKKDTVQPLRVMNNDNKTYPAEATSKGQITGIIDKLDDDVTSSKGKTVNMTFFDSLGYQYTAKFSIKELGVKTGSETRDYALELTDVLNDKNESVMDQYPNINLDQSDYTYDEASQKIFNKPDSYTIEDNKITVSGTDITYDKLFDANGNPTAELDAMAAAYGYSTTQFLSLNIKNTAVDTNPTVNMKEALVAAGAAGATLQDPVLSALKASSADATPSTFKVVGENTAVLRYKTSDGSFDGINGTGKTVALKFPGYDNFKVKGDTATTAAIEIDLSTTSNVNNNKSSTVAGKSGDSDGKGTGRKVGTMDGISIENSGIIYATYTNGQKRILGQIAVAEFENASGLEKEGENLYSATSNSGDFNGIGVDVTENGGKISTGVLEMSNVDLSSEFTEMITTQRGFQASSRIITVSDTMLEELVNLKR